MNLNDKIINLKRHKFIILSIIIVIVVTHSTARLIILFSPDNKSLTNPFFENDGLFYIFTMAVLLGPLIETILFQFLIIEFLFLFEKSRKNKIIILLVPSLIFGLSHSFNIYYVVFGIVLGALLSSCYLIAKRRKDINPFLLTFLVHSSYNFFVFFINEVI